MKNLRILFNELVFWRWHRVESTKNEQVRFYVKEDKDKVLVREAFLITEKNSVTGRERTKFKYFRKKWIPKEEWEIERENLNKAISKPE